MSGLSVQSCTTCSDLRETQPTSVWVLGVYDSDGRSDGRVVKHGDLVVAGGEARWVVVHVLDHQQDVCLTRASPAICRLRHQIVLNHPLPVQHRQSEQLTWGTMDVILKSW